MKKTVSILLFFFILSGLFGEEKQSHPILPDTLVSISIDGGVGIYLGSFRSHLVTDGAYTLTPVLDIYISLYFIKYFGMQILLSSGCVIHPASQPIEGTLLYMGVEGFGYYEWKRFFLKVFAGAGFQHPTMFLEWYASAFFEGGGGCGIHITRWLSLFGSVKYRVAFLRSIIIFTKYASLSENDRLSSLTLSLGCVVRIPNPFIRKKDSTGQPQ